MKSKNLKSIFIFLTILLHLLLILSCEQTTTNTEDEDVPVIPPQSSMQIDLSSFNPGPSKTIPGTRDSQTQLHFFYAGLTVILINTTVVLHLAIPAVLLGKTLLAQPELQSDGKYHWIFTSFVSGKQYKADFAGWLDVSTAKFKWEMYVTQSNLGLNNFLWYGGACNILGTKGDWMFYDISQPDTLIEHLTIDWQINSESDKSLIFTNVLPSDYNFEDMLTYQFQNDSVRIELFDASTDTTSKIVWHDSTTAGYIHVPNYHNGTPALWDENHQDLN